MAGPMLLSLNEIHGEDAHVDRVFAPEDFTPKPDDYVVSGVVSLGLDLHVRDEHVRVAGRVRAPLTLACGRCAEPFAFSVDATFDLEYVPEAEVEEKPEREIEPEEFALAYYEDNAIDLGALMQEQFYLAMPMKPLCQPDCRGLCALCGKNLNQGSCECRASWEDPRLAVLRSLMPQTDETPKTER